MVEFDNCQILINGSGILAESASLDSENTLSPAYVVGGKGILGQLPNGAIKNSIRFNYFLLLENDPVSEFANNLKNSIDSGILPYVLINFAGISGNKFYLENFSIKASPNEIVKGSATFISFSNTSGAISTGSVNLSLESLAYGWATYVASGSDYINVPTYDFSYALNFNIRPTYKIGSIYPYQVNLMDGQERIELERDAFYKPSFSGENACAAFMNCSLDGKDIQIKNLSLVCEAEGFGAAQTGLNSMTFSMNDGIINNSKIEIKTDDIVRVNTTILKYY